MVGEASKFHTLFKGYRLKAEFSRLSDLGNALAEKGFLYEDSIFSHWQKGTRIPQNRIILLKLLEIFVERKAVVTVDQANEFLTAAGQGYLSEEELQKIPVRLRKQIFQVPNQIVNFSNRQDIIKMLIHKEDIQGKIVILHGAAGVGKTALAIKLGHLLKDKFVDGVLWYKMEEDNIMDVLLSLAHTFGEDVSTINNLQVRATIVRSLLTSKNVLLILDSGELCEDIHLLIPNSPLCTTIITSQKSHLKVPILYIDLLIKPFTDREVVNLFKEVLKEKYPRRHEDGIIELAKRVGNLPLALHILARQMLHENMQVSQLKSLLGKDGSVFHDLYYEDKNLYVAIATSYNKLDTTVKSVLVSASIFKGTDFSMKSVGYINGLTFSAASAILQSLVDLSLLEHSGRGRYRIHPSVREFVREKLNYPRSSYLLALAIGLFVFFALWWGTLQLFVDRHDRLYYYFSASYGVLAFYGGLCGIHTSLKWGGLKTLLGRAIFMFSLGLFMQEFGQIAYSYYTNINHIQVPYPSLGDIGYFGTIPCYIYGVLLLAKSSGIKITARSYQKKIIALVIPVVTLSIGYFLFLRHYKFNVNDPVKTFLDFGYPLGEAVYISIAIIIFIFSRSILDGIMQSKALFLLIALVIQFIADYVFLYGASGFYSGSYIDFLYLISYFVMTLALLNLKSLQVRIKNI